MSGIAITTMGTMAKKITTSLQSITSSQSYSDLSSFFSDIYKNQYILYTYFIWMRIVSMIGLSNGTHTLRSFLAQTLPPSSQILTFLRCSMMIYPSAKESLPWKNLTLGSLYFLMTKQLMSMRQSMRFCTDQNSPPVCAT